MSDVLAGLRARFLERCVADLERLDRLMREGDQDTGEMQTLVHGLAGAAGTFGFPDISEAAGECDDAFACGDAPDREMLERLAATLKAAVLRRAD